MSKVPYLFLTPAALVAVLAFAAVSMHEAVVFDPQDYEGAAVPVEVNLQSRELPAERGGAATLEINMPAEALSGSLKDGSYEGVALCGEGNDENWKPYYLIVEIEVDGGYVARVADIRGDTNGEIDPAYSYDAAENKMYLDRAIDGTGGRFSKGALSQIQAMLDEKATSAGVDTVSGSTYSVVSIVQAYNKAVAQAVEHSK